MALPHNDPQATPRSAYFHIPFCRHRCGYCNFALVAGRDHLVDRYLQALQREVQQLAADELSAWSDSGRLKLNTLFFGGGTPSHLTPDQWQRLEQIVRSVFDFDGETEVTAECNPNDLNESRVAAMVNSGVNRISLGVQSLNPDKLKRLQRDHLASDVQSAIELARRYVKSISLDLIFAAPEETLEQWQQDLEQAMALQPDHLSTYELTYEKGTQFWNRLHRGQLTAAEEDLRAEMYEWTIERLGQSGWQHYELSSFARPGHRCRHNLAYWTGVPYLAFGPAASRFVGGERSTNHGSTLRYMERLESDQSPTDLVERLPASEAARERLVIALRMVDGVRDAEILRQTGFSVDQILGALSGELDRHGLIQRHDGHTRLTARGIMVADAIAERILSRA